MTKVWTSFMSALIKNNDDNQFLNKEFRPVNFIGLDVIDHFGLTTSTPRDATKRGGHLAVHHPNATQLVKDLASQFKVIADVRPPDIVRLGLSPLTTRFTDVWDGIERLSQLINR